MLFYLVFVHSGQMKFLFIFVLLKLLSFETDISEVKRLKNLHILVFTGLLLFSKAIYAQPDTIHLEDITISVTPFEERLSETTGSLSIIRLNPRDVFSTINIADEINVAPGVFMASGTYTTNRITIRGVGSRTPYSSNRIRAYFEEIPLTNGDGISAIEDLDMMGISRAEILKGPASAMYGSGLGGVIMLKASMPVENGFSYRLAASAGNFNTQKYGVQAGWKKNHTSAILGFSRSTSDGFRENNLYRRNNLYLHGNSGTEKNKLSFHLLLTGLYARIPSSLNETDFLESPQKAAANWLAIGGFEEYTKLSGGAGWNHQINRRWRNHLTVFTAWQDPYESRPFNILDDASFSLGLRDQVRYQGEKITVQAGAELFFEQYQWKIIETISGLEGALQTHNSEIRRYGNLFGHARWSPLPKLNVEAGVNLNLLEYRIETLFNIDNADQSGRYSYDPVISPRLGLNYRLARDHFLHASAGHGFSAPSLEETLLPEGLVNPDLLPETGWNTDLGIRGWVASDRWYYDVTAYTILMRNMLVTERITEEIFTGINAGSARLSGIEILNRIDLLPENAKGSWEHQLFISLFLNNNRFTSFTDDGVDYSGKSLPGIPAQVVNARFNSSYMDRLEWNIGSVYSGMQFMNDANTQTYKGHFLFNTRISYLLKLERTPFNVLLNGGINNLFNTSHASMILVNAPSFGGSAPRYYYPGLPRYAFIGFSLER